MIKQTNGTGYLTRSGYGSFLTCTVDWTLFIYFKYLNTPVGLAYALEMFLNGNNDALYLGSHNNTADIFFEATNHAGVFADTAAVAVTVNNQNWTGVTYTAATHTLELTVNGVSIGTSVVDLSSSSFDTLNVTNNGSGSPDVSCGYFRAWSSKLTLAQLTAEAASINAVVTSRLLWDCNLQTSIDLTDHNGGLNQLIGVGVVTTDTTDPLLSIVAGPPANTTPATAITVSVNGAYFQNVNTAGVATTVWHKLTAGYGVKVMGAMAYGDAATYKPGIEVYEGLTNANSLTPLLNIGGGFNKPIQFPVTAGLEYYFRSVRNGAVAGSTLQISILNALNLTVPIGSIAINDDQNIIGLVLMDVNTGYPLNFIPSFASNGEGGCPLSDGTTLVCMNDNRKPNIYDPQLSAATELNLLDYDRVSSNLTDTFLVSEDFAPGTFRLCDKNGNLTATSYVVGSAIQAIGLNVNVSKAYYATGTANNLPVKTWNILTNSADADLVAGVANYSINKDIIILQDGTILVPRSKLSAVTNYTIIRYNSAGAIQNTYDRGLFANFDNRIATAIDDPVHFFNWIKTADSTSTFEKIKVSDGSVPLSVVAYRYEAGLYASTATPTPVRFGHPESCPFWITRVILFPSSGSNARSGLYTIVENKRNDTLWNDTTLGTSHDVAIPNPFAELYAAGDE